MLSLKYFFFRDRLMKKRSLFGIGICAVLFSSCSVAKKASDNKTTENKSPRFLNGGVWVAPGNHVSTRSKSSSYYDAPSSVANNSSDKVATANALQYKYASLLEVPPADLTNTPLIQFVDDWYGVPYAIGGSTMDGIDCSAFSKMLLDSIYGEEVPRTAQEQYDHCKHIRKDKLKEGDLIFFHTMRGSYITHVGIYLQNNKFIHASSSRGVMISDLNDDYWRRTYRASGRVKPEDNGED